uniref:Uncharacterized protein n=1 Tax=Cucumis melo TaxID=3656 RepID=A0A9I9DQR4_CUCME
MRQKIDIPINTSCCFCIYICVSLFPLQEVRRFSMHKNVDGSGKDVGKSISDIEGNVEKTVGRNALGDLFPTRHQQSIGNNLLSTFSSPTK